MELGKLEDGRKVDWAYFVLKAHAEKVISVEESRSMLKALGLDLK